ncbi:DUF4262 domain-containing protein [Actinoplanes sp. NBC_00393]|uniref:DUF4262 domain-containing protein n=1 Tax=Actinoplanes sp. NBC_00393 TaxID=2975953 RepID=UPI002E20CCB6
MIQYGSGSGRRSCFSLETTGSPIAGIVGTRTIVFGIASTPCGFPHVAAQESANPRASVDGSPNDYLHPGVAFALYGRDKVRLQQLVWPDQHGRFPWESGYEYPPHTQPLIANPETLPPVKESNQ